MIITPILGLMMLYSCDTDQKVARQIEAGNKVINRIESFRRDQGRLPNSLAELGIEEKEEGPIYYDKKTDTKYILWFGTDLGESAAYDSEKKKWEQR